MAKKKRAGAHLGCSSRRLSRRLPIEDSIPRKEHPGASRSAAPLAVELRHPGLRVARTGRDTVRERLVEDRERGRVKGLRKDREGVGEALARARPDERDDSLVLGQDPGDRQLCDVAAALRGDRAKALDEPEVLLQVRTQKTRRM